MGANNGHRTAEIEQVKADQRDMRQVFMDEMRALHSELKHLKEIGQHNARALDYLLMRAKAEDERDDEDDGE